MLDPMLLEAQRLIDEFTNSRPVAQKQYRLYYHLDGTIIGLWETDHPEGNYIVLDDPDFFHRNPTQNLRVVNGKLILIEVIKIIKPRIKKSITGQPVVENHPAIALMVGETYKDIEHYDRNN